ncbi:ABC transporter substrate-binding protein [Actinokineospora cianjurensis]|uniref:Alpha-glucoside transport system substrate-binding protein n=1 Tax=Actinokineospora cianjurensis TaxID=585224 RepID=A0A421AU74_9PSEU|nr:extracellular solute-binding protein [Actinokineospora cianjurensis]RLK53611.1 alpha-glucoside transport system substrate-binding protein [Actinokineospora cianjurensis]
MRRLVPLLLTALLLSSGACGLRQETLTVLASWTGDEEVAFRTVLDAFTEKTGIAVTYTGTRALTQVLQTDVQKGGPPDIAVLPSPAEVVRYVRAGAVKPMADAVVGEAPDAYSAQWRALRTAGTDTVHAIPVKVDLKSIVWYDPAVVPAPPGTWAELIALTERLRTAGRAPWCVGLAAAPASGWPGTDWVEDILLHQAGPEVYRRWAAGTQAWTSAAVRQAWLTWGSLVFPPGSVRGGVRSALVTDFGDASKSLTGGGCALEHQASFAIGGHRDADYFPFPSVEPGNAGLAEVSADLAVAFTDSGATRAFMAYLASADGQRIWPARGTAFSPRRAVEQHGTEISTRIARTLADSPGLCFDASDLMPARMSGAFQRAALAYLADPTQLDTLLTDLDRVRVGLADDERLDVACGR